MSLFFPAHPFAVCLLNIPDIKHINTTNGDISVTTSYKDIYV